MKPIVAYLRVSTSQQRRSGFGVDAQREALARFANSERYEIVAEFVEVETGKGSDALDRRPELAAALVTADEGVAIYAGLAARFPAVFASRLDKARRIQADIASLQSPKAQRYPRKKPKQRSRRKRRR